MTLKCLTSCVGLRVYLPPRAHLQAFPDRDDVFIRVNSAPVRAGSSGSSGAAAAASDIIAAVVVMEDITDLRDREADRLRLLEEERGAKVRRGVAGPLDRSCVARTSCVPCTPGVQASSAAKSE